MDNIASAYEFEKKSPRRQLRLEFHAADHCNLNCQMCDHFSPLARKNCTDAKDIGRDLERLSALSDGEAEYIRILGGEPLLNSQIGDFFQTARHSFPNASIELFTNGLLLPAMPPAFWASCRQNGILIAVTRYPIALDYNKIETMAGEQGVTLSYTNTKPTKKSWHFPLDLNGAQDIHDSFSHCCHANTCIFLKNGTLYPCPIAPNIDIFNYYFGYALSLDEKDGINIYAARSVSEITAFLSHPIPFCRYCNVKARTKGYSWKTSDKVLREWTLSDEGEDV